MLILFSPIPVTTASPGGAAAARIARAVAVFGGGGGGTAWSSPLSKREEPRFCNRLCAFVFSEDLNLSND